MTILNNNSDIFMRRNLTIPFFANLAHSDPDLLFNIFFHYIGFYIHHNNNNNNIDENDNENNKNINGGKLAESMVNLFLLPSYDLIEALLPLYIPGFVYYD